MSERWKSVLPLALGLAVWFGYHWFRGDPLDDWPLLVILLVIYVGGGELGARAARRFGERR